MKKIILFVLIFASILEAKYRVPKDFLHSKIILTRMYADFYHYTFYSHTLLSDGVKIHRKKFPYAPYLKYTLILKEFPYTGDKFKKVGKIIEWEHIVPVQWFTTADPKIKQAWYDGDKKCKTKKGTLFKGRKCARLVSKKFNLMEADMFNLVPVIGALNEVRGTKPYCIIPDEKREFGNNIDFEVNKTCVEVAPQIRGDVARIMLYMVKKYDVNISDKEMKIMQEWKRDYNETNWTKRKEEILTKYFDYNITY